MNFEMLILFSKLYHFLAACGHISCFWCVHRSMSGIGESRCPTCRHPYIHFPTICQMLHLLLLKLYPVAYKRRENQILGELHNFYLRCLHYACIHSQMTLFIVNDIYDKCINIKNTLELETCTNLSITFRRIKNHEFLFTTISLNSS